MRVNQSIPRGVLKIATLNYMQNSPKFLSILISYLDKLFSKSLLQLKSMIKPTFSLLLTRWKKVTDSPHFVGVMVGLILMLALFLRGYGWQNYPFGFDQVQILENAERILTGDITLIGPRTGPAPMFTGPLIYYVTAVLLAFIPAPYTVVATALLLSFITGAVMYWLVRRFQSPGFALTVLTFWAVAPLIVTLDRTPWNPNLTILAAALCFLPLLEVAHTKKTSLINYLCIMAGTFLGYQAHFSGLLLPGLVLLSVLLMKPQRWLLGAAGLFGLAVSLVPTLLFDLRNNWLNVNGFLSVVSGKTEGPSRWDSLVVSTVTVLSNWGRVFIAEFSPILVVLLGVVGFVSLIYFYYYKKTSRVASWIPFLWLVVTTLALSFYRGNKPEYYFLLLMPMYLWWTTYILWEVAKKPVTRVIFLSFLTLYSVVTVVSKNTHTNGMSLGNQLAVRAAMQEDIQLNKVKTVIYDMEQVHSLGLLYLLRGASSEPTGKIYHVVYPYQQGNLKTIAFTDVAVWVDPRTDVNRKYVTQPTYILSTPFDLSFYQDLYLNHTFQGNDTYVLRDGATQLGHVVVYRRAWDSDAFDTLTDSFAQSARQQEWAAFDHEGSATYAYWSGHHFVVLRPLPNVNFDVKEVANQIVLIN